MISARNQLPATVKNVKKGAVNDEITLELAGGATLTAIITSESTQNLGLAAGKRSRCRYQSLFGAGFHRRNTAPVRPQPACRHCQPH